MLALIVLAAGAGASVTRVGRSRRGRRAPALAWVNAKNASARRVRRW
jgi:hypothetical protein